MGNFDVNYIISKIVKNFKKYMNFFVENDQNLNPCMSKI